MKLNLLLTFSLLLSTLTAGDLDRILGKSNIILIPQGFVLGTINSAGFSHLLNYQTANSGAINPASLHQFKENAFGFSYQFDTKVDPADFVDIYCHYAIFADLLSAVSLAYDTTT